ncbi:MAG: hypothetical protein R3E90_05920 [Marinicella sp.]
MNDPHKFNDTEILVDSLKKAAHLMKIADANLANILHITQTELDQLQDDEIDPESEISEIVILTLNVLKELASRCGNNNEYINLFLYSENKYFDARPIDFMKKSSGFTRVLNYLVAMGGKH